MRWQNGRRGGGIEDRRGDRRVARALVRSRETAGGAFDSRVSDYGQNEIRSVDMSRARVGRRPGTTYTMGRR